MAKSVMSHKFSQVPNVEIPRSTFDRSHGLKTTFDAGLLIPIYVDEALPGDTFNMRMSAFTRLATPIKPLMDNMFIDTFFFAVPYRLLWENWEKFNGAQDNPEDTTDYVLPSRPVSAQEQSLEDYMGLPIGVPLTGINSLPFRAYNLIWNEWFRDQNLQDSVPVRTGDGGDLLSDYTLLRRGKRHDYFTSALPFPQKGDPVTISLGEQAPVTGLGFAAAGQSQPSGEIKETGGVTTEYDNLFLGVDFVKASQAGADGFPEIYADLSRASAITINSVRESFQVQRMFERDARGGTRYTEILRSHFGVTSPDARLQRPEYLGGGSSPINIQPVAQTQASGEQTETPQGNLAALGTAAFNGHGFNKSFTEHCVIIGLACARADLTYQQGINRMWSRETRFDFYWPSLARLGEQAILNKEIYAQGNEADDELFGYQERYAEYRYKPSQITGKFRSTASEPLDIWHLSQEFAELPTLSDDFIQDDPPIDRVIAVTSEPHFLFDAYFQLKCARPMPIYGVPGMLDHF